MRQDVSPPVLPAAVKIKVRQEIVGVKYAVNQITADIQ
jgi:hypothetical protein